jgi:hypothetical protein
VQLRQMLPAARIELLEPRAQKPSYRQLLHFGVAVVQNRFNRLANTGRAWTVGSTTLSVVSGVDEYQLDVFGVGKVLDVTYSDPLNVEGTERQVSFHDITEMAGDFRGDAWDGQTSRIAFFRKDGLDTLWAKVRPIPTANADYLVSYSTGTWVQDANLDDSPLLAQHHHLFVAEIARDALAGAEWSDDLKADELKRSNLERSLTRRIERYDREFDQYVASLNIPRNTYRAEAFPIE